MLNKDKLYAADEIRIERQTDNQTNYQLNKTTHIFEIRHTHNKQKTDGKKILLKPAI